MFVYRMENGVLNLIRYKVYGVDEENRNIYITVYTDDKKEEILKVLPRARVEKLDFENYEWLDKMRFTEEQIKSGEIEKAANMGECAYKVYALATDRDAQILDIDYRLSLLELGIGGDLI